MSLDYVLGIDAGGTHTDAALLAIEPGSGKARLLASAKALTNHDDLAASVSEAAASLSIELGQDARLLKKVGRVTLGTTLEINALVQNRADEVGLALSAGPGLDPRHFTLGRHVCIVEGGLDHRGVEIGALRLDGLRRDARKWAEEGLAGIACAGKFSPRNPAHEKQMAHTAGAVSGLPVCMGHSLSGQLNFPRRIATTYYNAAVRRLHERFLDSIEAALQGLGIVASVFLLKADGGSVPAALSRREPVQSILSGPAASAMGIMALWPELAGECTVLMDMGGTTTDMAVFVDGFPALDRDGMHLLGRRTLVRSLASVSIGIGGDSRVVTHDANGELRVSVGPVRDGPAMCFGGPVPALMDALNILDGPACAGCGDVSASRAGMEELARQSGCPAGATRLARLALDAALGKISTSMRQLLSDINERPIYTLAALRSAKKALPARICLVGGPAFRISARLQKALGLPVITPRHAEVANAVGAALTMPTASLDIYIDTARGLLRAPAIEFEESMDRGYTLAQARSRAMELLAGHMRSQGMQEAQMDIVNADLFATLDDRGYGSKDIRVGVQVRPSLAARLN